MALESATHINDLVTTNPAGTDSRTTADDHLRLIKDVLKRDLPLTAAVTSTAAELNYLDGIGTDPITNFPVGTLMLFQQTAAPTGWTKQTTHNDKSLRVVSGTAGSGGTDSFSTVFAKTAADSYTLLAADVPAHDHGSGGAHTNVIQARTDATSGTQAEVMRPTTNGVSSDITTDSDGAHTHTSFGGGGGHTHGLANFDLQYVDLIIASKD